MTLLFYLKPANEMIVAPHEWDQPEGLYEPYEEKKKRKRYKIGTIKQIEEGKRLSRKDEEEILILFMHEGYDD